MKANCIHMSTEVMIMATLNSFTDVVTLTLPMPLLWRLQISRQREFQLIGLFLTGGL